SCRAPSPSCLCFFFFSSRRRHTRFSRDWSSDVCSSDLALATPTTTVDVNGAPVPAADGNAVYADRAAAIAATQRVIIDTEDLHRSEERRVGKECRSRWSP